MKLGKIVIFVGIIAMGYGLYNGFVNGDFLVDGKEIMDNPWGIMSLIDIYVSMLIFSAWVAYRESSIIKIVIWIILNIGLGSLAVCVYVLIAMFKSKGDWLTFFMGDRRAGIVDQW